MNTMLDTTLPTLDIPDTAVVMSFPFTSPREPGSYVRNNSGTTHTPLEFFLNDRVVNVMENRKSEVTPG